MKKLLRIGFISFIFLWFSLSNSLAQTVSIEIFPSSISFPDANPDTAPLISANDQVIVDIEITDNTSGSWILTLIAYGDLENGKNTIPVENITWKAMPSPPFIYGTMSKTNAQIVAKGTGDIKISAQVNFFLKNSWYYIPGNYSRTVVFTLIVP